MDDLSQPRGTSSLSLQQPQWGALMPDHFVPLRLILLPNGVRLELTKPDVLIGRHSDVDVRLPLPDVSRRHCRVTYTQAGWFVHDLNSLNGIFVNGKRVPQAPLQNRDRLRIGGFTFEVELPRATRTDTGAATSLDRPEDAALQTKDHRRAS